MICSAPTPNCHGEVRLYRLTLRPLGEQYRLCDGCHETLTTGWNGLRFTEVAEQPARQPIPMWRRRSLARDMTGNVYPDAA